MDVSGLTCVPRLPPSKKKEAQGVDRPLANYKPSDWGEFFIHSVAPPDQKRQALMQRRVEELKEEVKASLADSRGHEEEEMDLVDALQRLGLGYHFQKEINEALVRIRDAQMEDSEDLHVVSLRFRLLRQQGYIHVSLTGFDRFKDVDGRFKKSLSSDVKGLLSLYEAAHVGTPADLVLEEAITFCKSHLEGMLHTLQPPLAAEVARTLKTPLIRRMRRLEARQYISFYEASQGRRDSVLELAKLDFNLLQSMHQEELRNLSVWWKELGMIKRLTYARDRLVECYFWIVGVYYEPHLKRARMMMSKLIALISILDDTYDAYGTVDELDLLTRAIERWDVCAMDELPEYMKIYFRVLMDTVKEFEEELLVEQKSYRVEYLKEEWKLLSSSHLQEAKWSNDGYVPTLEEHLNISSLSSGYKLLSTASFLGMGNVATKEAFDWTTKFPQNIKALCTMARLMDDIVSYEFEQKRPHVASTVQSYMKEYSVTKEVACQKLREMIEDAWKVINQEILGPSTIPLELLMTSFNLARMAETYYNKGDGYTDTSHGTADFINLLFVKCV